MGRESEKPTPYATNCRYGCGKVYMTREFYMRQMMAADSRWRCARCGEEASWDDDNYEEHMEELREPAND